MRFSDAHCHVHFRTYNWLRFPGQRQNKKLFHPWVSILSNDRKREKGKRADRYDQSNLVQLRNGHVGLVFNVLYPLEKEFFALQKGSGAGKSLISIMAGFISSKSLLLRGLVQRMVMDRPMKMIRFFRSPDYDYWQELKNELSFVLSKNGERTRSRIFPRAWRRVSFRGQKRRIKQYPEHYKAEGTFCCPRNKEELEASLQKEEEITMLLTIEGAHSLGSDTASASTLLKRVEEIRSWECPVFYITMAHHFYNNLCGHARSFSKKATLVLVQLPGMNGPVTENGFKLLRKLLMLDENNQPLKEKGYRILIDVKHMAARSRKDFYTQIVEPCYRQGDPIPLIASHAGYSGRESLDELISGQEKEDYTFDDRELFNSWSINICAEDIQMVFKTGGIIGISFDQRILGLPDDEEQAEKTGRNNIKAFWYNVKGIVHTVYQQKEIPKEEKCRIWDCLCIGTDFNGYINPLTPYPTAVEFSSFARDLKAVMLEEQQGEGALFDEGMEVQTLVEKICYRNLEHFALRHFPK